jgi:hypothetical protein
MSSNHLGGLLDAKATTIDPCIAPLMGCGLLKNCRCPIGRYQYRDRCSDEYESTTKSASFLVIGLGVFGKAMDHSARSG